MASSGIDSPGVPNWNFCRGAAEGSIIPVCTVYVAVPTSYVPTSAKPPVKSPATGLCCAGRVF